MDDEEIQELIAELRIMLVDRGFDWVVGEAEAELYSTVALRTRALALIDAAESVTTHLADVELRILDRLEIEDLEFRPDEDDLPGEGGIVAQASRDVAILGEDSLRGAQRRTALKQLAEQRLVFEGLRRRLDGDE